MPYLLYFRCAEYRLQNDNHHRQVQPLPPEAPLDDQHTLLHHINPHRMS